MSICWLNYRDGQIKIQSNICYKPCWRDQKLICPAAARSVLYEVEVQVWKCFLVQFFQESLNSTGSFRNTLDFIFHVMDSRNIEYSCIVYNREQSKENVRIIRMSEFHRYYPMVKI